MAIEILGVKLISQQEVGKLIGTKTKSTVCKWLARANLTGIPIKKQRYYSETAIKDVLTYGKLETRQALELLREIKKLNKGESHENNVIKNGKTFGCIGASQR